MNIPCPASLANINAEVIANGKATVSHLFGGSFHIDAAKMLGFGTSKVMVRFAQSDGWTVIDPLTWDVFPWTPRIPS